MCLGVPGKIVETFDSNGLRMGKVDFGGTMRETCLEYVPEAQVGDYTIIHVGFAISILSEEEANETLDLLRQMVDLEDEIGPEMTTDAAAGVAPGAGSSQGPGDPGGAVGDVDASAKKTAS